MYNGRNPAQPEPKQPPGDWGRPRKGSYCEYKQERMTKVPLGSQDGPLGIGKAIGGMNRSVIDDSGRRNSVTFYDKDVGRGYDLGLDKYASKELREYERNADTKYQAQPQQGYPSRYTRPSSSKTQQTNKGYISNWNTEQPKYPSYNRAQSSLYSETPVGTIVPAGQRRRSQAYQSISNEATYETGKGREPYVEEINTRRERGAERRPDPVERGFNYEKQPPRQTYYPQNYRSEQVRPAEHYSKHTQEAEPAHYERRDRPIRSVKPEIRQPGRFYSDIEGPRNVDYEPRKPASRNYGQTENKYYMTERETEGLSPYQSKSPYGQQKEEYEYNRSQNATPTRTKNIPRREGPQADEGLSQSRKQQLIEKSKHLNEKMNELSASKKLLSSASKDQKQFRFNAEDREAHQERIERIKNNKDRVYDSPFKDRIKSNADLRVKYQLPIEPEPTQNSQQHRPRPVESILKKADLNQVSSLERSQDLLRKLNQLKEGSTATSIKERSENEENRHHGHQGHQGPVDSNCMSRINALNSKINEKISLLINAYQK